MMYLYKGVYYTPSEFYSLINTLLGDTV